jgi:predicted transcriptional regulator of viral defense system
MEKIVRDLPTYFDYNWLQYQLRHYASPRVKINAFLKTGEIIRIKKGLYVPGTKYNRDISRGVLANLIYGPSYVSYEYALSRHGCIPEKVVGVTSACAKKNKEFSTPVGTFRYRKIPENVFSFGVELTEEEQYPFLIASPEKALVDRLAVEKGIATLVDVESFLMNDLRFDFDSNFNSKIVTTIATIYRKKSVILLAEYLKGLDKSS